ncbi:MAG: hypothetical protein ACO3A2_09735 [Bdellovibrionia bacterium]
MNDTKKIDDLTEFETEGHSDEAWTNSNEVLTRQTQCAICGSHLHLTHITNFVQNLTEETARCPECGIQARRFLHRLH